MTNTDVSVAKKMDRWYKSITHMVLGAVVCTGMRSMVLPKVSTPTSLVRLALMGSVLHDVKRIMPGVHNVSFV